MSVNPTANSERRSSGRRPGRPRSEGKDSGEVRERLLEAATELAVEQGFESCGIREIAARAQVSSGMIAYYFGDRDGLHEAMFERAFDRLTAKVTALIEQEHAEGESDRLDELIRIHVSVLAADPWLRKLITREVLAAGDAGLGRRAAERLSQGPLRLIVGWLEEEQRRGVLRRDLDPRLMSITIAGLSVFPFLALPILGDHLGLEIDDRFVEQLIGHNQEILTAGIRAASEEGR